MHSLITKPFPPQKSGATIPTKLTDSIAILALELAEKEALRLGKEWPKSKPKSKSKQILATASDDDCDTTSDQEPTNDEGANEENDDPTPTPIDPQLEQPLSPSITCVFPDSESTPRAELPHLPSKRSRQSSGLVDSLERVSGSKKPRLASYESVTDTAAHPGNPTPSDTLLDELDDQDPSSTANDSSLFTEQLHRAVNSLDSGMWLNDTVITRVLMATSDVNQTSLVYIFDPSYAHRKFSETDSINIYESTTHAVLPICNNHHWMAAFMSIKERTFEIFDSMPQNKTNHEQIEQQVLNAAVFLEKQLEKLQDPSDNADTDEDQRSTNLTSSTEREWSRVPCTEQQVQSNTFDCGIFVLVNCLRRIHGRPLSGLVHGEMWRVALRSWLQGFAESWTPQELSETSLSSLQTMQPSDSGFHDTWIDLGENSKRVKELIVSAQELADILQTMADARGSEFFQEKLNENSTNITSLEISMETFTRLDPRSYKRLAPQAEEQLGILKRERSRIEQYERRCREARSNIKSGVTSIENQVRRLEEEHDVISRSLGVLANQAINFYKPYTRAL